MATKSKRLTTNEKEEQNIYYKPTYVGQNIKNIRSLKKITQEQLAKKALLSTAKISRIEKGAIADVEDCCRIAAALDVRLDMLIFFDHRISLKDLLNENNRFINKDYILDTVTIETIKKLGKL